MRIAIAGAGNVATHLAAALADAGHSIVGISSRRLENAERLAAVFSATAVADVAALPAADVYVLAVKDDALPAVIAALCPLHPDALFLHTAGSVPLDVFSGQAQRCAVLYPMQTFSKARRVDFRRIPLFIEACDEATLQQVEALAVTLSAHVVRLGSEARRRLHLAAVYACNFVNHCYALAEEQMQQAGLPFDLLLPLIAETAQKVGELSPRAAQTGPAVRWDTGVMERQEALLGDAADRALYRALSDSIHKRTISSV